MSSQETLKPGDATSGGKPGAGPVRLLLVDDEEGYVNVLANRLTRRGMAVTKTYSGSEAIRQARRHDFDVAVIDLKMEDMDGIEVLKILKKMDPCLMVIMLTGHGSEKAAKEGLASGAFDYLTKPCELDELLAKIKEAYQARILSGSADQ
jgi:DNA-binding response OmpR family regulator